jgi:hypothetical protein
VQIANRWVSDQITNKVEHSVLHCLGFHMLTACRNSQAHMARHVITNLTGSRSQWPRGLRSGPAAIHLLGLWVQIPPGAWMFVLCLLYKDSSMGHKVTWTRTKGFKEVRIGSKGKKSRLEHWSLSVVCCQVDVPAYHSSRGVLMSVACLSMIINPRLWGGPGPLGAVVPMEKKSYWCLVKGHFTVCYHSLLNRK